MGCTFDLACSGCGAEKVLYLPLVRIIKRYSKKRGVIEKAMQDDVKAIKGVLVKKIKARTINRAQFIHATVLEAYQCSCGEVLDIDKFITVLVRNSKNEIKKR